MLENDVCDKLAESMSYCWDNIIERHGIFDQMFRYNRVPGILSVFLSTLRKKFQTEACSKILLRIDW